MTRPDSRQRRPRSNTPSARSDASLARRNALLVAKQHRLARLTGEPAKFKARVNPSGQVGAVKAQSTKFKKRIVQRNPKVLTQRAHVLTQRGWSGTKKRITPK